MPLNAHQRLHVQAELDAIDSDPPPRLSGRERARIRREARDLLDRVQGSPLRAGLKDALIVEWLENPDRRAEYEPRGG